MNYNAEIINFTEDEIQMKHLLEISHPFVHTLVMGQVQSGKTSFIIKSCVNALENYSYNIVIVFGGTNNKLYGQTDERMIVKFRTDHDIAYIQSRKTKIVELKSDKKYVINCMKDKMHLEWLNDFLSSNVENAKALIIDDESDFASIPNKNGSAVHNKLKEISENFKSYLYLSVTATPYAEIMSDNSWNYNNVLLLQPNDGYCGIDFFIEHKELFVLDNIYEGHEFLNEQFWISLLIDHLCRVYKSDLDESQLLINLSIKSKIHSQIRASLMNACKKLLEKFDQYSNLPIDIDQKLKIYSILQKIWDERNIYIFNQNELSLNKNHQSVSLNNKHSIIIGGNIISRGMTFEKLFTFIFLNEPQDEYSADTLMQRMRIFGYREKIFKFMKIYCSEKIWNSLLECQILNDIIFKVESNDLNIVNLRLKLTNVKFDYIKLSGKL